MNRHPKPAAPNMANTRYRHFQGLLNEPVMIATVRGHNVDASAYNILTSFTHQKERDSQAKDADHLLETEGFDVTVETPTRNYHQAPVSFDLGSVPGVGIRLLFLPDQRPTTPGGLWVPAEMELIGPGTGSLDLALFETGGTPIVDIQGSSSSPEIVQEEVRAFFGELGALASTKV